MFLVHNSQFNQIDMDVHISPKRKKMVIESFPMKFRKKY